MLVGCSFLPWDTLGPEMGCGLADQSPQEWNFGSSPWMQSPLSSKAFVWQPITQIIVSSYQPDPTPGDVRIIRQLWHPAPSDIWLWEFMVITGGGLSRAIWTFTVGWEDSHCSPSSLAPVYSLILMHLLSSTFLWPQMGSSFPHR